MPVDEAAPTKETKLISPLDMK